MTVELSYITNIRLPRFSSVVRGSDYMMYIARGANRPVAHEFGCLGWQKL